MDLEEVKREIQQFASWEHKFHLLMKYSKNLSDFPKEYETEDNRVRVCGSKVWIHPILIDNKLQIQYKSEAKLLQGILFILSLLYEGQPPKQAIFINPMEEFKKLGILSIFSGSKYNGLSHIILKVRKFCRMHLDAQK